MQTIRTRETRLHPDTTPADDDIATLRDVALQLPLGGEPVHILRGVSFAIPRRSWIAIMGASGSGKSTLLGILAVEWLGFPVTYAVLSTTTLAATLLLVRQPAVPPQARV